MSGCSPIPWPKAAPEETVKGILDHHECKNPLDIHDSVIGMTGVNDVYNERVQSSRSRTEQQVAAVVDGMSDADPQAQGICPPGVPMFDARKITERFMVDEFFNRHGVGWDREPQIFEKEMDWYNEIDCFYPSRELKRWHPGLAALKC